ncbi:MAG TPA: AraC family transcriptional regulator [Longimicrobium sp.]|nr:AraC family transcriptional regulator [Longimicrobium sp.]
MSLHTRESVIDPIRARRRGRPRTLTPTGEAPVVRARAYLEEHWSRNVPLDELAAACGLSKFHLTRQFARVVGVPPHAFQNRLRVARAAELLREGVPVGEVARRTGFADASHLSRHFKRATGTTPGRYAARP